MEKSLQMPCFLLQLFFLNASCFMHQWSFNSHFTSFESSLFFTLKILGSSLFRERARSTRLWSFVLWACLVRSSFPNSSPFFLRDSVVRSNNKSWRRDSIPQFSERMDRSRPFFPKTTVYWLGKIYLVSKSLPFKLPPK